MNRMIKNAFFPSMCKALPDNHTLLVDRSPYGFTVYACLLHLTMGLGCVRHRRVARTRATVVLGFTCG